MMEATAADSKIYFEAAEWGQTMKKAADPDLSVGRENYRKKTFKALKHKIYI